MVATALQYALDAAGLLSRGLLLALEKLAPFGRHIGRVTGGVLLIAGFGLLLLLLLL